jgi:hypothetical protein
MLSPREFATLVLVKHAERIADVDQLDLRTLLDLKFVEFNVRTRTSTSPRLSDRGHALLARLHVMHRA